MPKKDQNSTQKGTKKKKSSVTIKATITDKQREIIDSLIGYLGSNEQDVIGNIITLWLYNEGFLKLNSSGLSKPDKKVRK